jgi:hypothetical protein
VHAQALLNHFPLPTSVVLAGAQQLFSHTVEGTNKYAQQKIAKLVFPKPGYYYRQLFDSVDIISLFQAIYFPESCKVWDKDLRAL